MKKLFVGLLAVGMFQLSQAQTKDKATPKPLIVQNEKGLEEVEPPPPPPPPFPPIAEAAPPPPPPPPPPKAPKKKTTFTSPVIVKDEKE